MGCWHFAPKSLKSKNMASSFVGSKGVWVGWLLYTAVCVSVGCSAVVDIEVPSDAQRDGGAGTASLRLVPLGEPRRRLAAGEEARFEVLCVDERGAPRAGVVVRFDLLGEAEDSSLRRVSALTDGEGTAAVRLIAGHREASFRLRAGADGAAEVWFDVEVGGSGEGDLLVVLEPYRGVRRLDRVALRLVPGTGCGEAGVPLREGTLPPAGGRLRWTGVPAREGFHLVAEGEGAAAVVSSGHCLEDVSVEPGGEHEVRVALVDRPLDWSFSEGALSVSASSVHTVLARWAHPEVERLWASWGGVGPAIVQRAMRRLRGEGAREAAMQVQRLVETSAFDEELAARWAEDGGLAAIARSALEEVVMPLEQLDVRLTDLRFAVERGQAEASVSAVRDAGDSALSEADGWGLRMRFERLVEDGFETASVEVDLPLGTLARRLLVREVVREAFVAAFGCPDAAAWAVAYPGMPMEADEELWTEACRAAFLDSLDATRSAWDEAGRKWPVLRLQGRLSVELGSVGGGVASLRFTASEAGWDDVSGREPVPVAEGWGRFE